jgi:hypothetical protein
MHEFANLGRRAHAAQGVVLVDPRHAEQRRIAVADELLDRGAVTLNHRLDPGEVPRLHRP